MKKKLMKSINKYVSPVCYGTLTFGLRYKNYSYEEGAKRLLYAYENGINFWDGAQYYDSHRYIGAALKLIKDKYPNAPLPVISTRSLDRAASDMKKSVEEALSQMNVDHIDIFSLHEVLSDEDWEMRKSAWNVLKEYKKAGIIGAIGVSTHHVNITEKMAAEEDCDVVFSLINKNSLGIRNKDRFGTKEEMEHAIKMCADAGKDVYTMKAFGGGNIITDYVACLDYSSNIPGTVSVAVGLGTDEETDTVLAYFNGELSPDYTPRTEGKRMWVEEGDCIGCGACIKRCNSKAISLTEHNFAVIDTDKCVQCNYCAPVCPMKAIVFS